MEVNYQSKSKAMIEMIYLFIVEASLEIVPEELWRERSVINEARRRGRKPGEMLLNMSKHYAALKKLGDLDKRGRPDISHLSLLTALDSPLNLMGKLQVYLHTRNGEIIHVNSEVNLPRNYERFEGLCVALLRDSHVPKEKPYLMEVVKGDLSTIVDRLRLNMLIALSTQGRTVDLPCFLRSALRTPKLGFMVGGFQRGGFSPKTASLADDTIRLSSYPLSSHVAICKILHETEEVLESGSKAS